MQPNLPNKVFILDTNKHPLNPISPKQARKLLGKGKAAVYRQFPFTIILKSTVDNPTTYPLTLKIDPGWGEYSEDTVGEIFLHIKKHIVGTITLPLWRFLCFQLTETVNHKFYFSNKSIECFLCSFVT